MSTRLEYLRSNSQATRATAARHKAFNIAVFGSVARGEDNPNNDIDILVDFQPGASLVDEYHLENDLQEFLKNKVDLISGGGLNCLIDIQFRG